MSYVEEIDRLKMDLVFALARADTLAAERDRARDLAAHLEEESARLRRLHEGWHVCVNDGPGSTDYVADDDVMEPCPTVRIIDGSDR